MHELLVQWMGYVVPWIETLGIVMVLWGIPKALAGLVRRADLELARDSRRHRRDPHGDRLFSEPGAEPGNIHEHQQRRMSP